MEWTTKHFNELTKEELYEILKARVDIFVVEQECPYPEIDGKDPKAYHLMGREDGELAAYVRIFLPGDYFKEAAIGRVLVKEKFRRDSLGTELMERAMRYLKEEWQVEEIKISAQEYLLDFYNNLGFKRVSETYLEDGIPHLDMLYQCN